MQGQVAHEEVCLAHTADATVSLTIPITKSYRDADGNLYVEGIATDDALDLDEQIIDKDFSRRELPKWFADWGNVRQMHSTNLPPAGKAVECRETPDGFWVKTLVVEPGAQKLVENQVYQAYSVGISKPRIIRDSVAKGGRVVDGVFSEISLVDFPALPKAKFQIAKRAGDSPSDPIEIIEKAVTPALTKATPADLAKGLVGAGLATGAVSVDTVKARAASEWYGLVKRDMDPDVGGGVDRDKIPGDDFAGPNRSFPIVTPGDVSDAAHLIGHADDPEAVKQRIIEIAHRKGKEFVAELPDSWKNDSAEKATDAEVTKGKADPDCKTCHGSGKIRDGHVDCPDCVQKAAAEPEVTKGGRDCTNCGDKHDADFEGKFCPGCGHKLPGVMKAEAYHREPDETVECPHCHKYNSPDAKFCDQCGEKLGGGKAEKRKDAEAGVDEHPEPDGDEDGPDLDRDGDGTGQPATAERTEKSAPMPYHLARLHDATCAAFRHEDVVAAHPPVAKGVQALVDTQVFADAVTKALTEDGGTGTRIAEIPALSEAYAMAVSFKSLTAEELDAAVATVRKAFSDMYPDAHPKPTDITPGQFKRPYVSAGRAPMRAGKSPRIPLASHVPSPGQFDRGPLTAGQERQALAKAEDGVSVSEAEALVKSMHDYIAEAHPGACPMMFGTRDGEPATPGSAGSSLTTAVAASTSIDNRAGAVPTPVSAEAAAAVTKDGGPALDEDLVKRLVSEAVNAATEPLTAELATLRKSMDEIASQPDPDAQAYRGSAVLQKAAGATQTPAGRGDDAADNAVQDLVRLVKRAKHPDSEVSTPAISKLIEQYGPDAADLLA